MEGLLGLMASLASKYVPENATCEVVSVRGTDVILWCEVAETNKWFGFLFDLSNVAVEVSFIVLNGFGI